MTDAELDKVLEGFAGEVRVGRLAGPIAEEMLASLSDDEAWQMLNLLARRELDRLAASGREP